MLALRALEVQVRLGGEDLIPFYGLLEGGREGSLFKELEDYFYYAQIRRYTHGYLYYLHLIFPIIHEAHRANTAGAIHTSCVVPCYLDKIFTRTAEYG